MAFAAQRFALHALPASLSLVQDISLQNVHLVTSLPRFVCSHASDPRTSIFSLIECGAIHTMKPPFSTSIKDWRCLERGWACSKRVLLHGISLGYETMIQSLQSFCHAPTSNSKAITPYSCQSIPPSWHSQPCQQNHGESYRWIATFPLNEVAANVFGCTIWFPWNLL